MVKFDDDKIDKNKIVFLFFSHKNNVLNKNVNISQHKDIFCKKLILFIKIILNFVRLYRGVCGSAENAGANRRQYKLMHVNYNYERRRNLPGDIRGVASQLEIDPNQLLPRGSSASASQRGRSDPKITRTRLPFSRSSSNLAFKEQFVEEVHGSGVLVYLSATWLSELYQQVLACNLLERCGYNPSSTENNALVNVLTGMFN